MSCPNCGKELKTNQKFCTHCGFKIDTVLGSDNKPVAQDNTNRIIISVFCIIIMSIVIGSIFCILGYYGSQLSDSLSENSESEDYVRKASDCEAVEVKDLALKIFKENNEYYKAIDKSSIKNVELRYPAVTSYDETIDKYQCTAEIIMESENSGFLPANYDYANKYYSYINDSWTVSGLAKYTKFRVNIAYSSQISEGNTLVSSSETYQQFSCPDGNCSRIVDLKYDRPKENYNVQSSYNRTKTHNYNDSDGQTQAYKEENFSKPVSQTQNTYNYNSPTVAPKENEKSNYNKEAEDELF